MLPCGANFDMETIAERSIEQHLLDLIEQWKADLFDLNFKDVDGWNEGNRALASAQYAYIKKARNRLLPRSSNARTNLGYISCQYRSRKNHS